MFVKSIVFVALFCVATTATAQSFDSFDAETSSVISDIRVEAMTIGSLNEPAAEKAIQRGQSQIAYVNGNYEKALAQMKKGNEAAFWRLGNAIDESEVLLAQNIAIGMGLGAIKTVLAKLEKQGKISNPSVSWQVSEQTTARGVFFRFPKPYNVYVGVDCSVRAIKVSYVDVAKKQQVEIAATLGSFVRSLKELENLKDEGTSVRNWVVGDVTSVSGIVENDLRAFLLKGSSINFIDQIETASGWRDTSPFHTYYYGVVFVGDVEIKKP